MVAHAGLRAVEDEGHVAILACVVKALELLEQGAVEQSGAHDEDRSVHVARDDLRIGDDLDRRTVEQDVVVLAANLFQQVLQAAVAQQLGGVRRHDADWQDAQVLIALVGMDELVKVPLLTREVMGQTDLRRSDQGRGHGLTDIAVDDEHLLLLDGQRHGDIGREIGLTTTRVEGGHDHHVVLSVLRNEELELRTEHAEGLVHHVALALLYDDLQLVTTLVATLPPLALASIRYFSDKRYGETLDILAAAHGGVHALAEVEQSDRQHQTQGQGDEQDVAVVGRDGIGVAKRGGDDADVVGGEGLVHLVLLALLEQEEVELLLDLLLTAHAREVLLLLRAGGDFRRGLVLVLLRVAQLQVDCAAEVVDALQDDLADLGQLLVVVAHDGVALRGVGDERVALEQERVVFCDLLLNARRFQSGVGRQELARLGTARQHALHVLCHGALRVEGQHLLLALLRLLHGHLRGSLYGRQQVAALIAGDVAIDTAQLALDDSQALVDKLRRGDRQHVLVSHPALLIDRNEGVDDVVGAVGLFVLIGNADQGGHLARQFHRQVSLHALRLGVEVCACHEDWVFRMGDK